MKTKNTSRFAKIGLFSLLAVVLGFVGLTVRASKIPLFDPAPKGEGSYKEAAAITKRFREYYLSKDLSKLPEGYVQLKGIDLDGDNDSWVVYYATTSHSKVRGGTIVLLGSDGRMDTYFGHHCSSVDGGRVMISDPNLFGEFYEGEIGMIRTAFEDQFKQQETEQVGAGDAEEAV